MAETLKKTTVIERGRFDRVIDELEIIRASGECESAFLGDMVPDGSTERSNGEFPLGRWTITVEFEPAE